MMNSRFRTLTISMENGDNYYIRLTSIVYIHEHDDMISIHLSNGAVLELRFTDPVVKNNELDRVNYPPPNANGV